MDNGHMRKIDCNFETDLRPGGLLAPLLDLVKQQENRLLLTFRKNYISIYYRGDSLYKIKKARSGYIVSFDFNHARYTENYNEFLVSLRNLGFSLPENRGSIHYANYPNNPISKQITQAVEATPAFWAESYKLLTKLTDDYLDDTSAPGYDYFKDTDAKKKANHLERQRQHEIALSNRDCVNGYFVYDIEYAEPAKTGPYHGRYDMLALRIENRCAKELLLIELKSTQSACMGKSGIEAHREDMLKYLQSKDILGARREEACAVMDSLHNLFGQGHVDFPEPNDIPVTSIFILTDEAQSAPVPIGSDVFKLAAPWKLVSIEP